MQVRRVAAVVVALVLLTGALSSAVAQTGAGTAKAGDSKALLAARVRGSATAPITVYEMSDFQCPYCRNFALETWPALEERYVKTGKVKWVFINFPITSIHKNAAPAAAVAMCAAKQGKFWPMHDVLFRTQKVWSSLKEPGQYFLSLADSIGASKPALRTCAASGEMDTEVENDAAGANRAGAASTPTFYIEGGLLQGAQPLPVFTQILDSIYTLRTKPKKG